MRQRLLCFLILVPLVVLIPSQATAQTPEATTCTLNPVSLPLFAATPAAAIAATPEAPPATEPDLATFNQSIAVIFACINTGQPELAWAIFTPHYIATWLVETGSYQPEFEKMLSGQTANQPDAFELTSIGEPTTLDDGRVQVTIEYATNQVPASVTFILTQIDGIWLIDEVVPLAA